MCFVKATLISVKHQESIKKTKVNEGYETKIIPLKLFTPLRGCNAKTIHESIN